MLFFIWVNNMGVKIFDEECEVDLECDINDFLVNNNYDIIDVKYCVAVSMFGEEQVYCFSAMVIYNEK